MSIQALTDRIRADAEAEAEEIIRHDLINQFH